MINSATFRIIGRIGSVNTLDKVTHLSIASDRRMKDHDGSWITGTDWNSVTVLSGKLRKRLEDETISRHGNLIIVEGTIQSSSYMKDDEKMYSTSLVVQDFDVLGFAKKPE